MTEFFKRYSERSGWTDTDIPAWLEDEEQIDGGVQIDNNRFYRLQMEGPFWIFGREYGPSIKCYKIIPYPDQPDNKHWLLQLDDVLDTDLTEFVTWSKHDALYWVSNMAPALSLIQKAADASCWINCGSCQYWGRSGSGSDQEQHPCRLFPPFVRPTGETSWPMTSRLEGCSKGRL